MALVAVRCPHCGSDEVIKRGNTGGQRYRCRNAVCAQGSFLLEYRYQGYRPRVKRQIVDMALNGSGIRDTARVLGISKDTVVSELKKQTEIEPINRPFLDRLTDPARPILLARVEEAEADEILWARSPAGCGRPWTIEPGLSSPTSSGGGRTKRSWS